MSARKLLGACLGCFELRLVWTHLGGYWRAKCPCGFSTRASTLKSKQLDVRALA